MRKKEIADRRFLRCAAERTDGTMPVGLPPDLIEKAGWRVGVAALTYAGAYLLAYVAGRALAGEAGGWVVGQFPQALDLTAFVFVAISIAFYFFARSGAVSDERLLDLGLVYLVVAAAGIDQYLLWGAFPSCATKTSNASSPAICRSSRSCSARGSRIDIRHSTSSCCTS